MNHYHAIIAHSDVAEPNQRITLEAETIEQAGKLVAAKFGQEAVLKVWQDYFETNFRGYGPVSVALKWPVH